MSTKLTTRNFKIYFIVFSILLAARETTAQPGTIDSSFAVNGMFQQSQSYYKTAAVQKDKKIIAAGRGGIDSVYGFFLTRINTDGSIDKSFGNEGNAVTDFTDYYGEEIVSVAVQQKERIIAAGSYTGTILIAGYTANGRLDSSFGINGEIRTVLGKSAKVTAMTLQADDKIIVTGYGGTNGFDKPFIVRFTKDGTLDSSFAKTGELFPDYNKPTELNAIRVQNDGKIIVGGTYDYFFNPVFFIARYLSNGTLDNSFGKNGITRIQFYESTNGWAELFALAIQPDGKIICAGNASKDAQTISHVALARIDSSGKLDKRFGRSGFVNTRVDTGTNESSVSSLLLQNNGKIIAAGSSVYYKNAGNDTRAIVACYNADGSTDSIFAEDGIIITNYLADDYSNAFATLWQDGKIVTVGFSQSKLGLGFTGVVARYFADKKTSAVNNIEYVQTNFLNNFKTRIFPNPATNILHLDGLNNTIATNVSIIDISGRELAAYTLHGSSALINVNSLQEGIYFLHIKSGENVQVIRFIKD